MPELRDALREATSKIGVIAGNPQLIVFDAMLTSYPAITIAGPIGFGVNPANAFAGAAATIELIANGANVPTFTGIAASGSWVNSANAVNRIHFECLPSGAGSVLAFYAKISQPTGSPAAGVTSVAGKTGAVTLDKGDVGLGAANNTADADKPISTATAAALTSLSAATQPRDSDLTAIAGLPNSNGLIRKTSDGNAVLQPITSTGAAVIGGDAAAGREAIGVGTLGIQNANAAVLTGAADFGGHAHNNFYFANSLFSNSGGGVGVFVDRLQAADRRFTITPAGAYSELFDASYETGIDFGGNGSVSVFEVDFRPSGQGFAYTYAGGFFAFHFYDYYPANRLTPLSIKIEMFQVGSGGGNNGTWIELATLFPADNSSANQNKVATAANPDWPAYLAKLRFTITTRPNAAATMITKIEYFASRPETSEAPQYLLSGAAAAQTVDCPLVHFGKPSDRVTIGPGTLKINSGATVTQILTATKTAAGTNPETISVTGAVVGDVAWVSEAVPAKVTAPNTVSFNGVGLSGTIRAIVMRAQ